MGAGKSSEPPSPSHENLCPKRRRLRESQRGDPPPTPTACPTDTHREKPVSIPGEETLLKSSSAPGETLGKRLRHWGMSKVTQRELALGLWGGERGWAGRSMDPGFEGPEVHTG